MNAEFGSPPAKEMMSGFEETAKSLPRKEGGAHVIRSANWYCMGFSQGIAHQLCTGRDKSLTVMINGEAAHGVRFTVSAKCRYGVWR